VHNNHLKYVEFLLFHIQANVALDINRFCFHLYHKEDIQLCLSIQLLTTHSKTDIAYAQM